MTTKEVLKNVVYKPVASWKVHKCAKRRQTQNNFLVCYFEIITKPSSGRRVSGKELRH